MSRIHSLRIDRSRALWLSGDEGIFRLRAEDYALWARGALESVPALSFGRRDGLRHRECNGWGYPASWALADGTLVYPTAAGIALVAPDRAPSPTIEPAELYVDSAWTGRRALPFGSGLALAPPERSLRLTFGVIELLAPESVMLRHRLEGADRDWVPVGQNFEAMYAYLPPGEYSFRLQARLPGQDWVERASPLAIVVRPKLHESAPFRATLLVATLGATVAAFSWRAALERRHARALGRERTFLREVIDTSPNPIFALDRERRFTLANRAAEAIHTALPGEPTAAHEKSSPRSPFDDGRLGDLHAEVLLSRQERTVPEWRIVVGDAARWFRVVKRPLLGADGEVEQVLGTAVDVTDFKVAEERLQRTETELRASRAELRRLAGELLRTQEEERRRLGRELHDDLTQRLAGLAMLVGSLERTAGQGVVPASSLDAIRLELEALATDVQALSRELHPALLERLGIVEALRSECATYSGRSGLRITFDSVGGAIALDLEPSLVCYRIAQEALRNAVKHARAEEISVRLELVGGEAVLSIHDRGVGFVPGALENTHGLGLASMAERAHLVGATFEVDSEPGRGTLISVRLPVSLPKPGTPPSSRA